MIDGMPILDAVVHPYNFSSENFRTPEAQWIANMVSRGSRANAPEGYRLRQEAYDRDWTIEEVATMSFLESYADLAVYHVLPVRAFHDGICSVEKGQEAMKRWPDRFLFYAGVDPMEGRAAIEDLERQVELLKPIGLKLYPNSWAGREVRGWHMDDPEIAFPLFARAQELGIKAVAIHKALPLGPVELRHYKVDDIDRAAMAFPDLNFEIVHGGMAFTEETAWQLVRFENVWVNLETTVGLATTRPPAFEQALRELVSRGPGAVDRLLWGTGCMVTHPRPHVENFAAFQFSDQLLESRAVEPLTQEQKANIFAGNYARMHGINLDERLERIQGDDFDRRRLAAEGVPLPPYSTTKAAPHVS